MKNLKKITSVAVMLVMMLALAVPAMAANVNIEIETPNGTDTGETYTVYRIFDATVNGETTGANKEGETPVGTVSHFENVAYTIKTASPFYAVIEAYAEDGKTVFELKNDPAHPEKKTVVLAEGIETYSAAGLAAKLQERLNDNEHPLTADEKAMVVVLENQPAPLSINNAGYYMILSSLGNKAVVDTVGAKEMTIKTKNDLPTLTKKITNVTNGNANDNIHATASYGSTVTFDLAISIPKSADKNITVHDTMDAAFTYVADSWEGLEPVVTKNADGTTELTFTITPNPAMDDVIHIGYKATVNDGVDTATALKNSAHLTYSNYTSTPSEVDVVTYEFDLVKTTSDGTLLDDATFKLYNAATEGAAYTFTYDAATKTYSYNAEGTVTDLVVEDGMVTVKGLAAGKYYLEETVTPDGYNTLTARQEVNLSGNSKANIVDGKAETGKGEIVVNLTGAELPSTGGIGTTIFYVVGGLLVVGAGVMLVTKKRVSDQEQ